MVMILDVSPHSDLSCEDVITAGAGTISGKTETLTFYLYVVNYQYRYDLELA